MARKAATTPAGKARGASRKVAGKKGGATAPALMRIRMYRLGVGDSFLLTLPARDGGAFHMLIDCGIHTAETGGADRIRQVAQDICAETGGKLSLVVGTHEHWDHLSGFHHARTIFPAGAAQRIWCAWTENAEDDDAKRLVAGRKAAVDALWGAVARVGLEGDAVPDHWGGVVGFFGDLQESGKLAASAAAELRKLAADPAGITYHSPGEEPFDEVSDAWRIFVLGPPRDRAALRHDDPRAGSGEAYPFGAAGLAATEMAAAELAIAAGLDDDPPFAARYQGFLADSQQDPFFKAHFWDQQGDHTAPDDPDGREEPDQDWRRIGTAWLEGVEPLALKLDRITNNTSLVLALELGPKADPNNPVILFAADAQVGNWKSWAAVRWPDYGGRQVTGEDLLRRTVVYKVGHHASHNATLMDGGLELMRHLRLALVPTNAEMAAKVGWGTLPWGSLLTRLRELTGDRLLRSDTGATANALAACDITVAATNQYFDIAIPFTLRPGQA